MRVCVMERGYRTSQCMTILTLTENINIFVTFVWKSVPKKRSHNDKFEKKIEKLKSPMIILSLLIDIFVNWLFTLVGYTLVKLLCKTFQLFKSSDLLLIIFHIQIGESSL